MLKQRLWTRSGRHKTATCVLRPYSEGEILRTNGKRAPSFAKEGKPHNRSLSGHQFIQTTEGNMKLLSAMVECLATETGRHGEFGLLLWCYRFYSTLLVMPAIPYSPSSAFYPSPETLCRRSTRHERLSLLALWPSFFAHY